MRAEHSCEVLFFEHIDNLAVEPHQLSVMLSQSLFRQASVHRRDVTKWVSKLTTVSCTIVGLIKVEQGLHESGERVFFAGYQRLKLFEKGVKELRRDCIMGKLEDLPVRY